MIALVLAMAMAPTGQPPIITPTVPPPIVRTNVDPNGLRFRDWLVQDFGDYTSAHTPNESGSVFGMLCGRTCILYVNFQTQCTKGNSYPAMINSAAGAMSISLKCHHIDKYHVLSTPVTDEYINMLAKGGQIGFAVPLASGRFNVSRFSLSGGLEAAGKALEMATKKANDEQEGLRDFTI